MHTTQLSQSSSALAPTSDQTDEHFRQLAEVIREVFWVLDAKTGQLVYMSPAFELAWERPVQSVLDDIDVFFESIHPDDRERIASQSKWYTQGKSIELEYRIVTPSGKVKWIYDRGFPIFDSTHNMYRAAGLAEDVTERKRIEQELEEARVKAEAASLAKTRFLTNMSHEIRTPLGAILGFSDLLEEPSLEPTDLQLFVQAIKRNCTHLLQVVDDVLDLSKVEHGQIAVEKNLFPLSSLLDDLHSAIALKAAEKELEFKFEIDPGVPPQLRSDPTRLRQILANILGNAVKFTQRGSVTLHVHARPLPEAAFLYQVVFAIHDTGIGLTADQALRLFKPFSQADASTTRRFGGTGLGLSLSRDLAHLLGGEVNLVQSTPDQGSTFEASFVMEGDFEEEPISRAG